MVIDKKVVRMRWKCEAFVHAVKAWEELEVSSHDNFDITWGEWSASRFGRLTPRGRYFGTLWIKVPADPIVGVDTSEQT
jgi:hypothetical protein